MIIGTYEKLSIGQIVVPSGNMALFDHEFKPHSNPFMVMRESNYEEFTQGLIDQGITPNYAEKVKDLKVNYYEISVD